MIKCVKTTSNVNSPFNSIKIESNDVIKYIGQSGTSGYASAAKGYLADYVLNNTPISWQPLYFDNSKNDKNYYVDILAESTINKKYEKYKTLIVHTTPDLWNKFINENKNISNHIGYCTWETNKLPKYWVENINLMSEVWVPSNFNKNCFIDSGVKSNIKVVPHIWHKRNLFKKENVLIRDYTNTNVPSNKFTFYSIGELNFRKGIEDLINVFDKFNEKHKECQLVLKIHYKKYTSEHKKLCLEKINKLTNNLGKSIYLILDNLDNNQILALHSFGDCYVSLNKGEGFGLTIFDAFNYGKSIITTGYGGQVDYLGKDYSGLIEYKIDKVSGMESFSTNYSVDQDWAYPDLDNAYEVMKKCYENQL